MKKITVLLLGVVLLLCSLVPSAAAEEAKDHPIAESISSSNAELSEASAISLRSRLDRYNSPDRNIISVADKGDCSQAPENSLTAIDLAVKAGADMVKLDVRSTRDKVLVLCADSNLVRVSPDADSRLISECDYSEIKDYRLYEGVGGLLSNVSEDKLATLKQAFDRFGDSIMLMLDFDWELRDAVLAEVTSADALESTVLICRTSTSEAASWLEGLTNKPMTALYRKTNIVFTGIAYSKAALEIEGSVFLASSNPYGFVFKPSVMKYAGKSGMRAIASTAEAELCGSRNDTAEYWNDLVRRGYSVIITSNIHELVKFIDDSAKAEAKLRDYYKEIKEWRLPALKSYIYLDYVIEYNRAIAETEAVLSKRAIGEQEAYTCIYKLEKSINSIKHDYLELKNGVAGTTISLGRIIIAVLAVVIVALVQIYFFKRRKKLKNSLGNGGNRLD